MKGKLIKNKECTKSRNVTEKSFEGNKQTKKFKETKLKNKGRRQKQTKGRGQTYGVILNLHCRSSGL